MGLEDDEVDIWERMQWAERSLAFMNQRALKWKNDLEELPRGQ